MAEDELDLLDRWCAGDTAAGNVLFKRHFASIYRFFQHKIVVDNDVDELVQETFLACLRGRDAFRRQSSFRTYVFAIARNVLSGYWRQRTNQAPAVGFDEVSIASLSTSAGGRLARRQDSQQLLDALRALPLDLQLLLELHYWEELDRDELAEIFEIEVATTRSRLFRARQALREHLAAGAAPSETAASDDALDAWARSLRPKTDDDGDPRS